MILGKRVGCGIITYNRPDALARLYASLPLDLLDAVVVVNDGEKYPALDKMTGVTFIHHKQNLGVGRSKNEALSWLKDRDVDHFFLIEDDIYVRQPHVFEQYILASMLTGIQHFNYSQHGPRNKDAQGRPAPRLQVEYSGLSIPFYPNCVGAFCYFSRLCLDRVGLLDERYYNAMEHADHTYMITKAGLHPPFWYFADAPESWLLLGDDEWSEAQSVIHTAGGYSQVVGAALNEFTGKHGLHPSEIPVASAQQVMESLQSLRARFGPGALPGRQEATELDDRAP
jgi:glycosyltransferase involved in cell wall biosynthesis